MAVDNAAVANLNLGTFLDDLLAKFGPALAEMLLNLLLKKSQPMVASNLDAAGAFDVKTILHMLLEKFGPQLLQKLADQLEAKDDMVSKLIAMGLRQYGDKILAMVMDFLQSPAGTDAITSALSS